MKANFNYHYLLSLSYDGSDFSGWIKQEKKRSIQETLEKAVAQLISHADFYLIGASKTDAKVHALDQKVLLSLPFKVYNEQTFHRGLNRILTCEIRVNDFCEVNQDFNVRDVKEKTYCYTINDLKPSVFSQRYELVWEKAKIDENRLQAILNLFVGEHEFFLFSGLSAKEKDNYQTKRKIDEIIVKRNPQGLLEIWFKAKGFIRYQIRMIIGAALQCYLNNRRSTETIIQERLNGIGLNSPFKVNACGLMLIKITY